MKLDSYKFPYELLEKMKDGVNNSSEINKDICYSLCSKNDDVVDRYHRTGKECVSLKELKCLHEEKPIGFYHVYPNEEEIDPGTNEMVIIIKI